jgi:hypothetical protein
LLTGPGRPAAAGSDQPLELGLVAGQLGELRDAAQVVLDGVAAVALVEQRPRLLVALEDVEDVAVELQQGAVLGGPHRGGARVVAHAGHLAEEVAGLQRGHRVVVVQRHRRVDGDVLRLALLVPVVLVARRQEAAHPQAQEAQPAALLLDVLDRRLDVDVDLARLDVEGRRAELPLAAEDLALGDPAPDHGAVVEPQEWVRDPLEQRVLGQLVGQDRPLPHLALDGAAIGQRPGGAGDHALAAGDARRVAHRVVQVEGDPGGIPLAIRPMTLLLRISLQPRMQRSQRMHALWSTAMTTDESSVGRSRGGRENREPRTSRRSARSSSSQSPCSRCLAQGVGWSDISSAVTVATARWTSALVAAVATFIPFLGLPVAGRGHDPRAVAPRVVDLDDAGAADGHRRHVLAVAQDRDRDVQLRRRVVNRRALRHPDLSAVDGQGDHRGGPVADCTAHGRHLWLAREADPRPAPAAIEVLVQFIRK